MDEKPGLKLSRRVLRPLVVAPVAASAETIIILPKDLVITATKVARR